MPSHAATLSSLTIFLFLSLSTPIHSLGCYSGGNTYDSVTTDSDTLDTIRNDFCSQLQEPDEIRQLAKCYNFGSGNRIDFSVTYDSTTDAPEIDDCKSALKTEMDACEHGSEQKHGEYTYKDDPNAGLGVCEKA